MVADGSVVVVVANDVVVVPATDVVVVASVVVVSANDVVVVSASDVVVVGSELELSTIAGAGPPEFADASVTDAAAGAMTNPINTNSLRNAAHLPRMASAGSRAPADGGAG
jgi:hypothetical protein